MNFCTNCEGGRPHRKPERGIAICEECGTENEVPWVPLLVITGGGGCGKTAVTQNLLRKENPYVVIEADYLLGGRKAFDSWDSYWNYVAIVSRTLARNLRPIVLVGWVPPSLIEKTASSKYFSVVHFLVLTCDPEIQTERLKARYRFGDSEPPPESITNALNGTNHIVEEANSRPNATVLDTTNLTQYETTSMVDRWILERLDR